MFERAFEEVEGVLEEVLEAVFEGALREAVGR
jgi:hypothetical protein